MDRKQQLIMRAVNKAREDWKEEGASRPPRTNPFDDAEFAAFNAYLDEFEKLEKQYGQSI